MRTKPAQSTSRLMTLRVDPAQAEVVSALLAEVGLRHGWMERAVELGDAGTDPRDRMHGRPIRIRFEILLSPDEAVRVEALLGHRLPDVHLAALPAVLADGEAME